MSKSYTVTMVLFLEGSKQIIAIWECWIESKCHEQCDGPVLKKSSYHEYFT